MSLLQNSNAISSGGYNLESSLRFRSSASAYLSRTPTTSSNKRTWTFSAWIKNPSATERLLTAYINGDNRTEINLLGSGQLAFYSRKSASTSANIYTNAILRDPSAWYHIIVAVDLTNTSVKFYINGELQSTTTTETTTNSDTLFNDSSYTMTIGARTTLSNFFDGYMTEVNFVDGQQLTADDFGEYDTTTGVWKPKKYTGTYGTNGFYLPMKETQQATGFNTVLYTGNGSSQSISNVGFSPDLVWVKDRTVGNSNILWDTVRATPSDSNALFSNLTNAESTILDITFNSNGFDIERAGASFNSSGDNYVAWCWDAGSSTVSNTDGSITSSVRANPDYGFSIITYTGAGSAINTDSVGHGLNQVPDIYIVKDRTSAYLWGVRTNLIDGSHDYLVLNATDAKVNSSVTYPTDAVAYLGGSQFDNASGHEYVAYAFHSVSGYSKFGSYIGNGSTSGPTVTTGFRPAFVMIKRADSTGNWTICDDMRTAEVDTSYRLYANTSAAENTGTTVCKMQDNGFQVFQNSGDVNISGGTYIYMAFADTRDAQFNFDASGNKNNWTANNINSNASSETTYDIMNDVATLTDEDTANYPVCNPLRGDDFNATYSNGNMTATLGGSSVTGMGTANWHIPTTGKWFWEVTIGNFSQWCALGIRKANATLSDWLGYTANDYSISQPGITKHNDTTYDASYTNTNIASGDVFGVAFDADNGTLKFYQNGADLGTAFTGLTDEYVPAFSGSSSVTQTLNFGQQPFKYTPPTGYKKLNTYNLPDSTIVDGSQYMNTVTYTGTGTTNSITGVGFSPDLLWLKDRTAANSHNVFDTVRGIGASNSQRLVTNTTAAEVTYSTITSVNSDGFILGDGLGNLSGNSNVAWLWRGSDSSAVSNTDGTITSTVSANTDSGFSVVTYTAQSNGNDTVGHGLSQTPKIVFWKNRTTAEDWLVTSTLFPNPARNFLKLNLTSALGTFGSDAYYHTSTTIRASTRLDDTDSYVAYCFAEVEGFSKIGSYTGNGSTDGPFVYTGFRPAFVMFKRSDSTGNWYIFDVQRNTYNLTNLTLFPNLSGAESTETNNILDILSNGFKHRGIGAFSNASGGTYIYMAFAENPFKHSLAR